MLSDRQIFKAAFLHTCVTAGLDIEQTQEVAKRALAEVREVESPRQDKQASVWPWLLANVPGLSTASDVVSRTASGVLSKAPEFAVGTYVGLPVAAGAATGYLAAKARGLNDEDSEELKTNETIDAYRRAVQQIRLRQSNKSQPQSRRPSRPML